jgi:hypothetical protein
MVRGANLEAIRRQGICLLAKDGSDTTVRAVKAVERLRRRRRAGRRQCWR